MADKTIQHVSVPNLKLYMSMKTELSVKEVGEFSIILCSKSPKRRTYFFKGQPVLGSYLKGAYENFRVKGFS